VGVVVSPWNFPIAIPCGGMLASLAAGNTVVLKPASDSVLTAWILCRIFWEAGVSQNTLQFLPGSGHEIGKALVEHPDVDFMILTGGTETALGILNQRPDLFLAAETGGKNATIVTAAADREQAVGNVIRSAFGHGGQKCSATSLLILEKEVFEDANFRKMLVDAAASLKVGPAWEFQTRLGPLIRPPEDVLLRGLTRLEPGETWALEPQPSNGNPHLWSPGIKWNVSPGSFTHLTELFGPVIGVMQADNLAHAIDLSNQTGYGLTAGIESLDTREVEEWKTGIRAGNLYINRVTTGAITLRQPFGGMGKSAVGPAIKAGGPDYVSQFLTVSDKTPPQNAPIEGDHPLLSLAQRWHRKCESNQMAPWQADMGKTVWAMKSYLHCWQQSFSQTRDFFNLRGQDNLFRYRPLDNILVCAHHEDSLFDVLARIAAARVTGCGPALNLPPDLDNPVTQFLEGTEGEYLLDTVELLRLTPQGIIEKLPGISRLRYAAPDRVPQEVYAAAAIAGRHISRDPVLMDGRLELLHYLVGQSICEDYHRYGNLGKRGLTRTQI
jgi:RHH-type proline utilization regulon transcriptional repressor/proline dehydrogenase/delta 1-pyrroline-5-carboxylate dehydrogenase